MKALFVLSLSVFDQFRQQLRVQIRRGNAWKRVGWPKSKAINQSKWLFLQFVFHPDGPSLLNAFSLAVSERVSLSVRAQALIGVNVGVYLCVRTQLCMSVVRVCMALYVNVCVRLCPFD